MYIKIYIDREIERYTDIDRLMKKKIKDLSKNLILGESYDESNAIGAPLGPSGDIGRTETGTSGPLAPGAPAPGPSGSQDVPSVDPVPSQTPVPTGRIKAKKAFIFKIYFLANVFQ